MKREIFITLWMILILSPIDVAFSAWSNDPTVNTPICTANYDQENPQLISDGSGGAIIVWDDSRSGIRGIFGDYEEDIYIQRLDSSGNPLWTADGVPVCTSPGAQPFPHLVSDGSGGAIVVWMDARNGGDNSDIYAQRLDASGSALWAKDGVPVCTATDDQNHPRLISDGSGGAIITWYDLRSGPDYDIYAQRLDASGNALWTTDGVAVCTATGGQKSPQLISDGSGGAIITWTDYRSGGSSDIYADIYAQRLDSSGNALWTADGVPVCTATGGQFISQLTFDGSGGAIISWEDMRSGGRNIYAQRVDSSGTVLWATDGVSVCAAPNAQYSLQIISDGSGGAIITWYDLRGGADFDIYAQRVDSSGNALWTADGVPVSTGTGDQSLPQLISDGSGGAIIIWSDRRSGFYYDIYVQRLDSSGNALWSADGVPVSTATGDQYFPQLISDGSGGAIITWEDFPGGIYYDDSDISAKRVGKDGLLGELKELIVPWFNDVGSYSSFITVHNPSPETVTVSVTYSGPDGQDATPTANTFTIGPARSLAGRPHQASDLGEGTEEGPPRSMPNSLAGAPFGSAGFSSLMPFGYSLVGDTLRMGSIPVIGFFSGIGPAYSK